MLPTLGQSSMYVLALTQSGWSQEDYWDSQKGPRYKFNYRRFTYFKQTQKFRICLFSAQSLEQRGTDHIRERLKLVSAGWS